MSQQNVLPFTPGKLIRKRVPKPKIQPEPIDIDVEIKHAHKSHLACRDFSHAWEWSTDFVTHRDPDTKQPATITRSLYCLRCGTERYDEYAIPSFQRVSTSYAYAENYLIKDSGHIPVATVRAEIMRRFKNKTWKD